MIPLSLTRLARAAGGRLSFLLAFGVSFINLLIGAVYGSIEGYYGGTIDIIINQDSGHEVRSAIRVLMSKADRAPIVDSMERIRIDIFLKDNLP